MPQFHRDSEFLSEIEAANHRAIIGKIYVKTTHSFIVSTFSNIHFNLLSCSGDKRGESVVGDYGRWEDWQEMRRSLKLSFQGRGSGPVCSVPKTCVPKLLVHQQFMSLITHCPISPETFSSHFDLQHFHFIVGRSPCPNNWLKNIVKNIQQTPPILGMVWCCLISLKKTVSWESR